ncbi:MAG TPA: hypothetical protein DDY20_12285 [Desulfobulbaceae bacterium]|nr:hypothetical protein [Desulfobulbaceae bacterium]
MQGDDREPDRGMGRKRQALKFSLSARLTPLISSGGSARTVSNQIILILPFLLILIAGFGSAGLAMADGDSLPGTMQHTRFISYTPRGFSVVGGRAVAASESGIRADLKLLRQFFDGLITYAATNGVEDVPAIAHEMNYRSVVMGIWDPASETEIQNVIRAARRYPSLVSAVIVGNEGLYTKRYQPADVLKTMQRLKKECPRLAAATSEPFFLYFQADYADFFKVHDLLMPNVHPIFEPWFSPAEPIIGVNMVLNVVGLFRAAYRLPLLIKETGMPSGPAAGSGFTPEGQGLFWSELFSRFPVSAEVGVACFEAFDAPWKSAATRNAFPGDHAEEAFWGFFTAGGEAKQVIRALPELDETRR